MNVLIIGAGIHGVMSGIELAQAGCDVTIVDKRPDILQGTSGATHNRAHMGYHYPRSLATGVECIDGLAHFKERFPSVILPQDSYYMIHKSGLTSMDEYKTFCDELGIPFNEASPDKTLLNSEQLEGGILTNEPIFDIKKLVRILKNRIEDLGIKIVNDFEIKTFLPLSDGKYRTDGCYIKGYPFDITFTSDIIINATYAHSNEVLKILDLTEDSTKYKIQHTEIIVVKSHKKIPSITIMDGKFVSIMKHGGRTDQYLLYDAKNSILHEEEYGYASNKDKIIEHFKEYFLFMDDVKYVESWFGLRPIPDKILNDSRTTRIKHHIKYKNIYSILEGKFISATMIAQQLKNFIC